MKIFKDIFTGDEMFSDSYKFKLVDDVVYEVYGKYVVRKQGEILLDGANPSAEELDEGTDDSAESGVDIVLNQRLQEALCFSDKKAYLGYLKDYMKNVAEKLKETNPNEVDTFKTKMNEAVKKLLTRFKDFTFYTGESCDCENGMVAILEYREVDGEEIPIMMFLNMVYSKRNTKRNSGYKWSNRKSKENQICFTRYTHFEHFQAVNKHLFGKFSSPSNCDLT